MCAAADHAGIFYTPNIGTYNKIKLNSQIYVTLSIWDKRLFSYFSQNYEDSKTSKVWTAEDHIIHLRNIILIDSLWGNWDQEFK